MAAATHTIEVVAPNLTKVTLGGQAIWFSYQTPVAYSYPVPGIFGSTATHVSTNVWTSTTGKHLSLIDGGTREAKAARLSHEQFEKNLGEMFP